MDKTVIGLLLYFLRLLFDTLGVFVLCGLSVYLIATLFSKLLGRSAARIFGVTSVVGTPIHELGHAAMCKLFGHEITRMRLWNPRAENGVYGYVEHSYSRRNLWAKFGNLFIGVGPLFSGLGVTVLFLWLCYPQLWREYLEYSTSVTASGELVFGELVSGVLFLFRGIPGAFRTDWLRSLLGLLVILSVCMHVSLSPADIRNSLNALPAFLLILAVFACATFWTPAAAPVTRFLSLFALRMSSLFVLVIAFSLLWLLLAAAVRMIRIFISWF